MQVRQSVLHNPFSADEYNNYEYCTKKIFNIFERKRLVNSSIELLVLESKQEKQQKIIEYENFDMSKLFEEIGGLS